MALTLGLGRFHLSVSRVFVGRNKNQKEVLIIKFVRGQSGEGGI